MTSATNPSNTTVEAFTSDDVTANVTRASNWSAPGPFFLISASANPAQLAYVILGSVGLCGNLFVALVSLSSTKMLSKVGRCRIY